jgi:hypothetical protein
MIEDSIPGRGKRFVSSSECPDRLWRPPACCLIATGALSRGVKRPGHEADNPTQSSAEVTNEWSYTFMLRVCLQDVYMDLTHFFTLSWYSKVVDTHVNSKHLRGYLSL